MASRPGANIKLSKALSWLLRHNAETQGFTVLEGGFLPVKAILQHSRFKGFTVEEVKAVVDNCPKSRFALLEDEKGELLIRANQGHSMANVEVDLREITDAVEFPKVIHGTTFKAWNEIKNTGLNRMKRNHIHFAPGELGEEGVFSGMRKSCQVYIYVNLEAALTDGFRFYQSANNVILCAGNQEGVLPVKYILRVMDHSKQGMKRQIYPTVSSFV